MSTVDNSLIYNQVDFVVKAPKFHISFSYTDDKSLSFIREYILRLLKIHPLRLEEICVYFDLNESETQIAVSDLMEKAFVQFQPDGNISLSSKGRELFDNEYGEPKLYALHEKSIDCFMELVGENFLKLAQVGNRAFAIEIFTPHEFLSKSQEIVSRNFQNKFLELKEDDFFEIYEENLPNQNLTKNTQFNGELYQIDDINKLNNRYFRFKQVFSIDITSSLQIDRNDIEIKDNDKLEQAVTKIIAEYKSPSNLNELISSFEFLDDEHTLKIIASGFNLQRLNQISQNTEYNYFIGQIYHQKKILENLKKIIGELNNKHSQSSKNFLWFGVDDIYWSAQNDIKGVLDYLIENQSFVINKEKQRRYNFKLYLPLNDEEDKKGKGEWLYRFQNDNYKRILYGFKTGFLNNNTEILVLEGKFAIVCYHTKLDQYDVTFPIGFYTIEPNQVKKIFDITQKYLNEVIHNNSLDSNTNDFGLMSLNK